MTDSDSYTSRARVAPAIIAVSPIVAFVLTLIPFVPDAAKVVPISVAVFTIVAGQLVRDAGERLEAGLFQKWGGPPTTTLLRYHGAGSDTDDDAMTARRHLQLEQLWGGGLTMPSPTDQESDPAAADRVIADFVAILRARTRDAERYPLLASENTNYGFRRNCLGLRTASLWIGLATAVACGALGIGLGLSHSQHSAYAFAAPLAVAVLVLLFFLLQVNEDWVHQAAKRYARALLETLDVLGSDTG